MRDIVIRLGALSLLLAAACSSGAGSTTVTEATVETAVPATTTTSPDSPNTTEAPPPPDSGRPLAPDFTLELGDGGVYTLSEGARPVYLVFWAEW